MFNIIRITTYYIILGTPQIKRYNPTIDQIRGRVLKFKSTSDIISILPRNQQYLIVDKKGSYTKEIYSTLNLVDKNN